MVSCVIIRFFKNKQLLLNYTISSLAVTLWTDCMRIIEILIYVVIMHFTEGLMTFNVVPGELGVLLNEGIPKVVMKVMKIAI